MHVFLWVQQQRNELWDQLKQHGDETDLKFQELLRGNHT